MQFLKLFFAVAIIMAVTITLSMSSIGGGEEKPSLEHNLDPWSSRSAANGLGVHETKLLPSKRLGRFLAEEKNPRAADHCHKDNELCYVQNGYNSTCCNNKCRDLSYDDHNCGACKKKCRFTEHCCRGQCVDTDFDKRNCGRCNHRCELGQYCVFGLCDYA